VRVLIAGCGYVGTELGIRLAAAGHEVLGLKRDPSCLPATIERLAADLLDPSLDTLLPPVDRVVYAASANESSPEGYRAMYVDALRNLIGALTTGAIPPPTRFLFVSSTAVYGDTEGGWVDEDTPADPESFRGATVLEGERIALSSSIPSSVLRLGGIYGPGRTRLLRMVREGRARCPGAGPIWSNRIHRDDAARALHHLLGVPDPGDCYVGVDDHPTPLCEVYRTLAAMLGAPEPVVDPDDHRDRANKRCSNRALRASGFAFRYPSFREGYSMLIGEEPPAATGEPNPRV
jgi:nucleoside-diphosphate-sugar epimerase